VCTSWAIPRAIIGSRVVWRGVFAGNDSLPEPLRVWDSIEAGELAKEWALPDTRAARGPGNYHHSLAFQTLLTSTQLAAYVHLPQLVTTGSAIIRAKNIFPIEIRPGGRLRVFLSLRCAQVGAVRPRLGRSRGLSAAFAPKQEPRAFWHLSRRRSRPATLCFAAFSPCPPVTVFVSLPLK
jgi:hypothetical protein